MIGKQQTIPTNWVMSPLCEVAEINPRLDKSAFADEAEVSFVPMPAVEAETGKIDVSQIRTLGEVKKGYTPFKKGDVLFAKITPCMENGKMAMVPNLHNNIGFGSTEFHVLRHHQGIAASFLYYFVSSKSFRCDAEHNMTGAVGQKRVPTTYLEKCNIPLPPSNEQQRIVAKLEELLSELDKGIESFKTAREQLTVYRQAVLKHAFEGKLTEEWRKKNAGELEPAETVLKKIKAEREQRCQQQLDKWKLAVKAWEASDKEGKKPTKPGKPKELPPLTEEELAGLPELPEGYLYSYLADLGDLARGKSKHRPRNDPKLFGEKYPFIQTSEVKRANQVIRSYSQTYNEIGLAQSRLWPEGTLCITIAANIAETAFLGIEACFPDSIVGFTGFSGITNSKYIEFFIRFSRQKIETYAPATAQRNINLTTLENLVIPYCSINEQKQIVQQIESRLSILEKLEQDIEDGLKQAETLRQSLLKKAFEGKLVAQDPNDEPASVLLARIKLEKAGLKQKAQKKKKAAV